MVIDPRVTSYAEEADIHAQLRPGTDGALALGMLNVIIKGGLYDKEFVEKWTIGFEKAMFVMAANPALIRANSKVVEEALRKLEFLVVTDIFMTPTAELADIILPACTFLEKNRFVAYDPYVDHGWNVPSRIVPSPKVVEPLEESWSDWKIILIAGSKLEIYTHSEMRNIPQLRELFPENLLEINPGTAAKLDIEDGNVVRVTSPRGGIKCMAKVTDRIDPRVVHLYHGFEECNCNVLTDHKVCDPITGSAKLFDQTFLKV